MNDKRLRKTSCTDLIWSHINLAYWKELDTHPSKYTPYFRVETDGHSIERTVQSTPAQPLSLPVRVHALLQLIGRGTVQG